MEWEPYQGKAVYEADEHPLWRVGNKHQEFLATKEHTWRVRDQAGNTSFRRTDELNSNSWIPFHAPYQQEESIDTPNEPTERLSQDDEVPTTDNRQPTTDNRQPTTDSRQKGRS